MMMHMVAAKANAELGRLRDAVAQRELEELSRQPEAECEAMAVPEALAQRREEEGAERAAELSCRLADATAEARTANAALKVGNGGWGG